MGRGTVCAIVEFSAEHTTASDNSLSLREQKCVKVKESPGIIKDVDHSRQRDGNDLPRDEIPRDHVFPLGGIRGRTCVREWIFTSCWTLSFREGFSFYFSCKALRTFSSYSISHHHCLGTQRLPQL